VQQCLHGRTGQVFEQPGLGRWIAERRGQSDQILCLLRKCLLIRRQHARDPMFVFADAFAARQVRQVAVTPRIALTEASEKSPQQFNGLGMIAAGRRYFVEFRRLAMHAEVGQQGPSARGIEAAQRDQSRVTTACQRRQRKARRQNDHAGQRLRPQLLQQPTQFRMQKASQPRSVVVLSHFRPIEDNGPAFAAQTRQQMIDAITGGQLRRLLQLLGISVQRTQTEIGIFAAIETPQENAIGPIFRRQQPFQPMLHDGRLTLSPRPDERHDAFLPTPERGIEQRQLGSATEKTIRLGSAVMNAGRTRHNGEKKVTTNHTNNTNKRQKKKTEKKTD